ncbi:[FeFe] hydrogenase H-cluster radical SAM maturase HydE [Shewanella sp. MMG014]|uniref:[FeFe] hydrogenase H-cluster radical SAM maturase HydE n=1 Tax=Shewanella sp. MMG014 TaxID=2822691 RepID=UPI001FFD3147|nr:[FeFe] hydrogenase H-cluster radical SAM maturase HydE [Shewanella sp. MMG014]
MLQQLKSHLEPVSSGYPLDKAQILSLLNGDADPWLFDSANQLTEQQFGTDVYLRGIVEFSNYCVNKCAYCGLRSANRDVHRYRLNTEQILAAVDHIASLGMGSVVLQSGDDYTYRADTIAEVIRAIRAKHDLAITLSLGDRQLDELTLWREAGADRYLLKMETFNRVLFNQHRHNANYDERIERIKHLQAVGYQTGSGIIVGLPGMNLDILADDILALYALKLDMIACGPYVTHPQTPMADQANGDVKLSLRVSAILRLMNPGTNIPATSSLDALEAGARERALNCGCNVVMPSFTPLQVSNQYAIYPGKNQSQIEVEARLNGLKQAFSLHNRQPSSARGDAKRGQYVSRN